MVSAQLLSKQRRTKTVVVTVTKKTKRVVKCGDNDGDQKNRAEWKN